MTVAQHKDCGLIGAGYWGKNLARNLLNLGVLHTVCDADPGTLARYEADYQSVRRSSDVRDVLDDPAITKVVIAAPAAQHFELAKAAIEAGKDVLVEKPLCLHEEDGRLLVDVADRMKRILMVGHLLQYHPAVRIVQSLVAAGELGQIYYITSNRLNLGKIRREENALWSFAPHDLSVILSLTGNKMPLQVSCTGASYLTEGVADTTLTTLQFSGGVRAHIHVSWLNPFKEQKLTVVGSQGMIVFDDTKPWNEKLLLHRNYLTWRDGHTAVPIHNKGEQVMVEESEPLRNECQHFLDCCASRIPPRTDAREGLRVLRVLQGAQRSLDAEGSPVAIANRGTVFTCQAQASDGGSRPLTLAAGDFHVHPTAVVDDGAKVGKGTRIWHFSHVMAGAAIGDGCILGQNVNVDGGARIGNNVKVQNNVSIYTGLEIEDDVFLGPSCVLTNVTNPRSQVRRHDLYERTVLKRGCTIGANATVVCGVTVGRYAFVAAGAVVTGDVPDYALVLGNPARQRGWMSRHGHRLNAPGADGTMICPESHYRYRETAPGVLRCLDLDEESPLPSPLTVGLKRYDDFRMNP